MDTNALIVENISLFRIISMPNNQDDKLFSTVEESVVMAMDGTDSNLFPYLPYIVQDLWEIGASPDDVLKLIRKHTTNHSNLKVLDLGCGEMLVGYLESLRE